MEAGVKGTLSTFTNDVFVDRLLQNVWYRDSAFSANYDLKESGIRPSQQIMILRKVF